MQDMMLIKAGDLVEPDGPLDGRGGEGGEVERGGIHQVEAEPLLPPPAHQPHSWNSPRNFKKIHWKLYSVPEGVMLAI